MKGQPIILRGTVFMTSSPSHFIIQQQIPTADPGLRGYLNKTRGMSFPPQHSTPHSFPLQSSPT